jgi:uncharacterized protein with HEPN domain
VARAPIELLADLLDSAKRIREYTRSGRSAFVKSPMIRDAVVARLIQIGEAVKAAEAAGVGLAELAPEVPWKRVAGMRDILSHQYWRIDADIVWGVVANDLRPLEAAARKLRARLQAKRR